MKKTYETLEQYLDDLDAIKERIAEETAGMNPVQVKAYFAKSRAALERITGSKPRTRRANRRARIGRE